MIVLFIVKKFIRDRAESNICYLLQINVKLGCWEGYEKPRGASQRLGEGYVRYSSIVASVDGDAYLLFLGAVGEGGHQLPHGLAAVG